MKTNCKIFASIIDDTTKKQVEDLVSSEAYRDSVIRIMPDCHAGKGCTIGSVIKYTDKVVPNTVGVDIGCGMLVAELGNVDINLESLDRIINEKIPSGFNVHEKPYADFQFCFHAPISDKDYILRSLGTLGGGNHFIELDVDDDNNKYLVIHSGSRNLGVQVCNYWQEKAISNLTDIRSTRESLIAKLKEEGRANEINERLKELKRPVINKELAYIEGCDLNMYLWDMEFCQRYAMLNRGCMAFSILESLSIRNYSQFTTIHNYIDVDSGIIRKGAIRASHGEKVIIPMNMRDGSLICVGKGNFDWLDSAPHGAGRIMSRQQAINSLNIEDFKDSMKGVYSTSVCESTIDEAPMVYKSPKQIMEDILPTVDIIKVIRPIYNFKAK